MRDELRRLQAESPAETPAAGSASASSAPASAVPALPTQSDTVTRGIRVRVRSFYVRAQSMPQLGQYFFAYNVQITNESETTVQLRSRHWRIADSGNKVEEVGTRA